MRNGKLEVVKNPSKITPLVEDLDSDPELANSRSLCSSSARSPRQADLGTGVDQVIGIGQPCRLMAIPAQFDPGAHPALPFLDTGGFAEWGLELLWQG